MKQTLPPQKEPAVKGCRLQPCLPAKTSIPELLLALPSQIPDQPVGVEGILGWHSPAHDGIQECLALTGVKAQNLQEAKASLGSQSGLSSTWHPGASQL